MSKLIIIRGNSGSGKTSVAKKVQKFFGRNTLLISQDMIRREMLWVHDGFDTTAIALLNVLIEYGRNHNEITILEGILNAKWYQPLFDKVVALYQNENIFAFYYDLSFEETLRRHGTRQKRFEFGEEELHKWWSEKDYIGFIKEHLISESQSAEEVVEMIVSKVEQSYKNIVS